MRRFHFEERKRPTIYRNPWGRDEASRVKVVDSAILFPRNLPIRLRHHGDPVHERFFRFATEPGDRDKPWLQIKPAATREGQGGSESGLIAAD